MDPQQQPAPQPRRRTPYISDFVASPRPQPSQATDIAPAPPAPAIPTTTDQSQSTVSAFQPTVATASAISSKPADQPLSPATESDSFRMPEPPPVSPREVKVVRPHQGLRDILSIFGVLVSALLLAFCLISFVFQSYQVDGPSMQSTLEDNDHLIVWKVPKTIAKFSGQHYIPKRADVIVFSETSSASGGVDKQLIKRVIALPGERVTVKNDAVTVYNQEFPNGFSPDKTISYGEVITTTPGNVDVTVNENEVFVLGDNRTNSLDSRNFGPIESDAIVGKLVLRVLPLSSVTRF